MDWNGIIAFLIDMALKGILLMAAAGLLTSTMRKATAATRHFVWLLAILGLLIFPITSLIIPQWHTSVLPNEVVHLADPVSVMLPEQTNAAPPIRNTTGPATEFTEPEKSITSPASSTPPLRSQTEAARMPMAFWIPLAWIMGFLLMLRSLESGLISVARLRRKLPHFDHPHIQQYASAQADLLGLNKPVAILKAESSVMPMAGGIFHPIIILPPEAESWSVEKLGTVLLHELAHIKRQDYLSHVIARVAVAMHWFNPLAWIALNRMKLEREHACDDWVLNVGEKPSSYAAHLFEIASAPWRKSPAASVAIPIARKSQLEVRLNALLDAGRNRKHMNRGLSIVGTLIFCLLLLPLTAMSLRPKPDGPAAKQTGLKTRVAVWSAIIEQDLVDRLVATQETQAPSPYQLHLLDSGQLMTTLREAQSPEELLALNSEMDWLEDPEPQRVHHLNGLDSEQFYINETVQRIAHFGISTEYSWETQSNGIDFNWGGNLNATLEHMPSTASSSKVFQDITHPTRIPTGQSLIYLAPMNETMDLNPWHLVIVQPVTAQLPDADYLRGLSAERWLSEGLDGSLQTIQASLAWADAASPSSSPADAISVPGVEILAIGRPAQWPHRWWDLNGRPIHANPAWMDLSVGTSDLAVVYRRQNDTGMVSIALSLPDASGGSASSSHFGERTSIVWAKHRNKDMDRIPASNDPVDLTIRRGMGDWTEIATIRAGQTISADGGQFTLSEVDAQHPKRKNIFGKDYPGLVLIKGTYDYDPNWEVALVAETASGQRTEVSSSNGSGQFSHRDNRRWFQHIQMDKADIDHFVILKRPVEEFVIEDLPLEPAKP